MWSEGGVEGLSEPLFGGGVAPREPARHLWGSSSRLLDKTTNDNQVSSSTSPSQEEAAVDLSIKSHIQVDTPNAILEGMRSSLSTAMVINKRSLLDLRGSDSRRLSSDDEGGGRLVIVEPPAVPESSSSPPPTSTSTQTTAAQTETRDFTSVKEVLLEMTNRKNGHSKILPTKWAIMKKEPPEQVLLKVPKFVIDDNKGVFPRPTALVNPFPLDMHLNGSINMPINGSINMPINGSTNIQNTINDWFNGKKIDISTKEIPKNSTVSKSTKTTKQRIPKGSNGKITSRKKPLTTIVAQLTGSVQHSSMEQTDPGILQKLLGPSESVSYLSSSRLTGGEVSISEVTPDISVVDRLKRLGTVIEIEDQGEPNSLKLLENMTKTVQTDKEKSKTSLQQIPSPQQNAQTTIQSPKSTLQISQQPPAKLQSLQLTPSLQVSQHLSSKVSFNPVPSDNSTDQLLLSDQSQQVNKGYVQSLSSHKSSKVETAQSTSAATQCLNIQSAVQTLLQPTITQSTKTTAQISKALSRSVTPKVNLLGSKSSSKVHNFKGTKFPKVSLLKSQRSKVQPKQLPPKQQSSKGSNPLTLPGLPLTTLYISKDVTLIPKLPTTESVHDKIEPSLLEPVIDIVEEENILSQDGTFLFKTDSYYSVDFHNEQKIFSCDICSAVYTHSNMLRKHYLRLHIARKYISEKDLETFNIDHEPVNEKDSEKLIFRCHTCRDCFASKNELRSHLTDHPPVVEREKSTTKQHPTYKCKNCCSMFKWRKQFGRHKKTCKPPPPPPPEKPELCHCLYCNETFLNANAKRNHILSNHPYVRKKHCCVFCKRDGFPTNVSLFHHLLNDHQSVYFGCQECKERFTNLEELKVHIDKKHGQDDRMKTSVSERISSLKQEKECYDCTTCQRKFLVEHSFKNHICFPEKQEKVSKPKLQKIKKKVYPVPERVEKVSHKNVDLETLFYSRVAGNVQDNLLNHLDGKIYKDEQSQEDQSPENPSISQRTFLNFSASFPSSSEIQTDQSGAETPTRVKVPWEKYNFPKKYDGRCGLSSYIKDTSYLDISTQLIMRRNLQRLKMLPMRESPSDDVPSVLALERLSAECAESFGQLKTDKTDGEGAQELGSLSGEWVRDRMYVCSACRYESPCLWTMEDHKYLSHPRVHCPQHELIGEQTTLSRTIYKRLIDVPSPPFKGSSSPAPQAFSTISCTKCSKSGFTNQWDLHVHILECAGVVLEAVGPVSSSKRKKRRTRRRPRRGLKRNIPNTPQKLPPKQRTKPGDTDTIQRMIANLPAKRVSRKVFSPFTDDKAKAAKHVQKSQTTKGNKQKKTSQGKISQSESPSMKMAKDEEPEQQIIHEPTVIKQDQDYIDTSAEGGDVLSSLRMMPVRAARTINNVIYDLDLHEKKENNLLNQADEKEMPKLEIEKDISPVESTEIPVLSPVERKDDTKKERDDLICGISFVDGVIKYETVSSVSQETEKLDNVARKRKYSGTTSPNESKNKKVFKEKNESQISTRSKVKADNNANKINITPPTPLRASPRNHPKEISPIKDDKPIPRKRGRPKGSLTKRVEVVTQRRSTRRSLNNSPLAVKFDEILPCDEEKEVAVKTPVKPKRKPRTVKESPTNVTDSTVIIVHAEVHPEPVPKRSEADNINLPGDSDSENIEETEDSKDLERVEDLTEENEKQMEVTALGGLLNNSNEIIVLNETKEEQCVEDQEVTVCQPPKTVNVVKNVSQDLPNSVEGEQNVTQSKTCNSLVNEAELMNVSASSNTSNCINNELGKNETIRNKKNSDKSKGCVNETVDDLEYVKKNLNKDSSCETEVNNDYIHESNNENASSKVKICQNINAVTNQDNFCNTINSDEISCSNAIRNNNSNSDPDHIDNSVDNSDHIDDSLDKNTSEGNCINVDITEENVTKDSNETIISGSTDCMKHDMEPSGTSNDVIIEELSTTDVNIPQEVIDLCETVSSTPDDVTTCPNQKTSNNSSSSNVIEIKSESETEMEDQQIVKKRKGNKKVIKIRKKDSKVEEVNSGTTFEHVEIKAEGRVLEEKKDNTEKEKVKKLNKPTKKDLRDISDGMKLKKSIKKRKALKKIVKLKKRFQNKLQSEATGKEVVRVAGFQWEVSELEWQPVIETKSETPDPVAPSADKPAGPPELLDAVQLPIQEQPLFPVQSPPSTTHLTSAQIPSIEKPPSAPPPPPSVVLPNIHSWENSTPWEAQVPDPSLGTIIDSVNKLLSDSECPSYTPLGLPSYSLADLQKAMGASDDEMAVLQQLGEASIQIASTDVACSGSLRNCDTDDWNSEKYIMDLDSHATLQKMSESTISAKQELIPTTDPVEPNLVKDAVQEWRWRDKSPQPSVGGSSSLLEAHQGKEVLCPSCSCHFMGFPALQKHLAKAHSSEGPTKQKRGGGTTCAKTDLNRRIPLDSSQSPRLVCYVCQQILPADRMSLHLEQEHVLPPEDISKCSSLSGESHDGPVVGDRLKSKMSSKLGDLLDRAVNNLLQAKHKPNNTLSGGAVELLTKLCAVRKREGSVKHRLHGARELLSKLHKSQHEFKSNDDSTDDTTKLLKASKLFSCSVCGHKFSLPSSRNKHEVLAHRQFRPPEYELEEYENDWREAPSPPEIKGENGAENAIIPQCSDCGLSFDTIADVIKHRAEDHTIRRLSVDNSSNAGYCPSPVPSSGGSRSLPESDAEAAGGDSSDAASGRRRKSTRKVRLSQTGSKSVKERAEAALRELNHPRQRTEKRWLSATSIKQKAADVYNFTDESL